ncbi:hypothetical protein Ae201684P_017191 [Aphanomyces euteiches]|nr:hypothetical protein Ae201684P_012393 [Aphanomyces euteiches]KAH9075942.1 hypothetical protein Ae201684P_012432 [Aphanomyces euteiches]KAH9088582.1 hypothetical protein Ae201684P_017191 [Aphanomyces euteiches]
MKALWEDTEIVDLLSTLFHNEFQQGAATVANSEQVATSDSPDERPEVPSKRRCQVDGCSNVLVSKGRCIRHGVLVVAGVLLKAATRAQNEADCAGNTEAQGCANKMAVQT